MTFDPGIGPASIETPEAEMAEIVETANLAFAGLKSMNCRWWEYCVSHRSFTLLIGDALARGGNLVISMTACERISGPVAWPMQQLRVIWEHDRPNDQGWTFTLVDDAADFIAVAKTFNWRLNHNLLTTATPPTPWRTRLNSPLSFLFKSTNRPPPAPTRLKARISPPLSSIR